MLTLYWKLLKITGILNLLKYWKNDFTGIYPDYWKKLKFLFYWQLTERKNLNLVYNYQSSNPHPPPHFIWMTLTYKTTPHSHTPWLSWMTHTSLNTSSWMINPSECYTNTHTHTQTQTHIVWHTHTHTPIHPTSQNK